MGLEDKSVITVALSGVAANRAQCPYIPYTPEEYASESKKSFENGCTMVNLRPAASNNSSLRAWVVMSRGASSGCSTFPGCGQKVSAPVDFSMSARCPE